MYFLTISNETVPTVDIKDDRVHRHGILFNVGYFLRNTEADTPFNLAMQDKIPNDGSHDIIM